MYLFITVIDWRDPAVTEQNECMLSILVPTLESRRALCEALQRDLERQISQSACDDAVEILFSRDNGEASVGAKRNRLIQQARGRFVVFIDDDDRVSRHYIEKIIRAIRNHPDIDCVSFTGEITFRGKHPRTMLHSIKYSEWQHQKGRYLRPPCHITPIRREIAMDYPFAEVDFAEDMDWTLRMSSDQVLRREVLLDDVLYFYRCRRSYVYQWLVDRTQAVRHALGLRYADGNRIRKNPVWRRR